MGLFDKLAYRLGAAYEAGRKGQYMKLPPWLVETGNVQRYNLPNMAMMENQAELYQRLSWVAIAVDHVSQQVATIPLEVKQMVGEETVSVPNHPFEKLMMKPNPSQSRFEFLSDIVMFRKLTGNSYIWLNKPSEKAPPVEMWTIPAHRIRPIPDGNLYIRGYMYDPGNGVEVPLEPWEVMHIKRTNPRNRYIGLSPIEAIATVSVGDMKMQEWNTNFFAKDNAKVPGVLTFADMIDDVEWEKIQRDFQNQYGGTKRNLMMLRGTGEGAVNWVATAMSQKDMEFLSAREFNKQEIFDLMAPGLTSWLSVNSTEANSKSGKEAFIELAVWPECVIIQEKISNDLMDSYGENQVVEFEDIRPQDALLQLKKQESYERTHTVAEVRKEYYGDDPLGDERDDKLVSGLGPQPGGNPLDIGNVDTNNDGNIDTLQQLEAKAHERDQFRRFAEKRVKEGQPEAVDAFKFKYLDLAEQKALKAEYVESPDELAAALIEAIKGMREAVNART